MDSALATVSGLNLKSENYKEAIDILEKRYGYVQVLISAFLTELVQLPKIKSKMTFQICLKFMMKQSPVYEI